LYCCLFYIFSYHTFDFSAKKNFGTLKPPHENFLCTPLQGTYANPSVLSLSLDQSNQLEPSNGKITPAVLLPLMPNRHLSNFWKCQKAVPILPHEAKALLELFCLPLLG